MRRVRDYSRSEIPPDIPDRFRFHVIDLDPTADIGNRRFAAFQSWGRYARDLTAWQRTHGGPPVQVLMERLGTKLEDFLRIADGASDQ